MAPLAAAVATVSLGAATAGAAVLPDAAFGGDGTVVAPELLDSYHALASDAQGRIVIVGLIEDAAPMGHVAVARVLPDGTADASFGGGDGVADTSIVADTSSAFSVADVRVLDDGTIVAAGTRNSVPEDPFSRALWTFKLTDAGDAAPGYGTSGVTIEEQPFTVFDPQGGVAADGSVVVGQRAIGGFILSWFSATGAYADIPLAESTTPACTAPPEFGGVIPLGGDQIRLTYNQAFFDGTDCAFESNGGAVSLRQTITGEWLGEGFLGEGLFAADGRVANSFSNAGDRFQFWFSDAEGNASLEQQGPNGVVSLPLIGENLVQVRPAPLAGEEIAVVVTDGGSTASVQILSSAGGGSTASEIATIDAGAPVSVVDTAATPRGFAVLVNDAVRFYAYPDAAPLTPSRLLDTRADGSTFDGLFAGEGAVAAETFKKVTIVGRGVPAGATSVVLNLTVVGPEGPGFATVYPCTPIVPKASNINYSQGQTVANTVVAQLDENGDLCVFTKATTHLLLDVNAFLPAGSSVEPVLPARLMDTRAGEPVVDALAPPQTPVGPENFVRVKVAGRGNVPTDATAALVNLTVTAPEAAGFATLYPCTPTVPKASNVNYTPGATVANGALVKLDNGDVCVFTKARADLILDVNGYVGPASEVGPLTPARLADTRPGQPTTDATEPEYMVCDEPANAGLQCPLWLPSPSQPTRVPVGPNGVVRIQVAGRGMVPMSAVAATLNLTVVAPQGAGFATLYPCTMTVPTASNVNYVAGQTVANSAVAALDLNGGVCVFSKAGADLIVDVTGSVG